MNKVFIMDGVKGIKVNCPSDVYQETIRVGRYTVKALLFPNDGYTFYIFREDVLKAIVGNDDWYISRMDGECQNLLNRILKIYG